jgi:hypothetical protein
VELKIEVLLLRLAVGQIQVPLAWRLSPFTLFVGRHGGGSKGLGLALPSWRSGLQIGAVLRRLSAARSAPRRTHWMKGIRSPLPRCFVSAFPCSAGPSGAVPGAGAAAGRRSVGILEEDVRRT